MLSKFRQGFEALKAKKAIDSLWSLAGFILPTLAGILFIPLIIKSMGIEIFGILSIIWMLIGYFTLFDLGISRALTFLLSRNIGAGVPEENSYVYSTAVPIVVMTGIIGGGIFYAISGLLVERVFNVSPGNIESVKEAFYWTAFAIPFAVWGTVIRSCLESYLEFKVINIIKVPVNIWFVVGPYIAYLLGGGICLGVIFLVVARAVMFVCYYLKLKSHVTFSCSFFDKKRLKEIFLFGGWMTVSNIVSPIMVYFDRFLIGGYLSVELVGYYSAPYEVVTKMLVVAVAMSSVFFPNISNALAKRNRFEAEGTIKKFILIIAALVGIGTLACIVGGHLGLSWWLGGNFENKGYWVVFWISLGVFFNSIAQIPFCTIQAMGLSKVTATIHILEIPIYLVLLLISVIWFKSISMVAFVWFIRVMADCLILIYFSRKYINKYEWNSTANA